MSSLILNNNNTPKTTSMIVAETFGKEHKNVLRDIENIECSDEFRALNFELSSYKTLQNKSLPIYFITRDGFAFLALGYTGPKAAKFKEAFIKAFNLMAEELLKQQRQNSPTLLPTYQRRMLSAPAKSCPTNRWCVFKMANQVMLLIEQNVGSICEFDLVDGSIGTMYVKYRQGKPWAKTVSQYWHEFKDKRGKQMSNCYEFTELEHFNVWLDTIYCTSHLHDYLRNKFKNDPFMLDRVKAFKRKMIGGADKAA